MNDEKCAERNVKYEPRINCNRRIKCNEKLFFRSHRLLFQHRSHEFSFLRAFKISIHFTFIKMIMFSERWAKEDASRNVNSITGFSCSLRALMILLFRYFLSSSTLHVHENKRERRLCAIWDNVRVNPLNLIIGKPWIASFLGLLFLQLFLSSRRLQDDRAQHKFRL